MYDAQGNLLEASTDPLVYLDGGGDIFPAIERALEGQEAGFEILLQLEPNEAFGDDDPGLLHLVPRASLGPHVAIGLRLEGVPGQVNDGRIYTVTDLTERSPCLTAIIRWPGAHCVSPSRCLRSKRRAKTNWSRPTRQSHRTSCARSRVTTCTAAAGTIISLPSRVLTFARGCLQLVEQLQCLARRQGIQVKVVQAFAQRIGVVDRPCWCGHRRVE